MGGVITRVAGRLDAVLKGARPMAVWNANTDPMYRVLILLCARLVLDLNR